MTFNKIETGETYILPNGDHVTFTASGVMSKIEEQPAEKNPLVYVVNSKCYAEPFKRTPHKTFSLTVEAILDMVPGAWHQPGDLMQWIAGHSYVRRVILDEVDRSPEYPAPTDDDD